VKKIDVPPDEVGSVSPLEREWLQIQASRMHSIAEIGCLRGKTTFTFLTACRGPVYAIDSWPGNLDNVFHADFVKNVGHFPRLIKLWEFSHIAAGLVPDVDMVFLDASKRYELLSQDLKLWTPKAKVLICGHDYGPYWDGSEPKDSEENECKRAVDEYFGENGFELFETIWFKWKDCHG
jgi:hypothetical protein